MERRTLLRLGLAATLTVGLVGGGIALIEPGLGRDGRLTPSARAVMAAVATAVLGPLLPDAPVPREQALKAHLERLDGAIAAFPTATRTELSRLFALLASPLGRVALAGLRPAWAEASDAELGQALQGMRESSLELRQQAYHALRDLTNAAWFADRAAWATLGYDGPVPV